jgi:hypothetical protein
MFFLKDECPVCGTAQIGFVKCRDSGHIVLVCFECHTAWISPEDLSAAAAIFPDSPGWVLEPLGCSIKMPESAQWATREEITGHGWERFIHTQDNPPTLRELLVPLVEDPVSGRRVPSHGPEIPPG